MNKIDKKQKSITLVLKGNKIYLDVLIGAIKNFYGLIDNVAKEVYGEGKKKKPQWIVKDINKKGKIISLTTEIDSKLKKLLNEKNDKSN